jgi:hypothetical protein
MVEIPELLAALRAVPQDVRRKVRSLQMLRLGAVEVIDSPVQILQSPDLGL